MKTREQQLIDAWLRKNKPTICPPRYSTLPAAETKVYKHVSSRAYYQDTIYKPKRG